MDAMASRSNKTPFLPAIGPVLMISMGYVDLGKWLAAVEAGARFRYDLVFPMILFNVSAILCQYLSACTSMVTGKNLAELCGEEYSRPTCSMLGFQAKFSVLTAEVTTILGIAHGINLLIGVDLVFCIILALLAANILPFVIRHVDLKLHNTLMLSVAGFALLFYVLAILVSQPEIPLGMNVMSSKLSGESAFSLMALLGASVVAHNFYIHSSFVQEQRRPNASSFGSLCHDHLFSILFIFTGISLATYVLMNAAAALSFNAELFLNFQDVVLFLEQIFTKPIAPLVFLMVLLFSGQIVSLTCNFGGQVILRHLLGLDMAPAAHFLLLNVLAVIPAMYCAMSAGAEGVYQLLISCQVIQAMLLPSSVIPLFRIASSKSLMGTNRISWYLEVSTFFAFLVMLFVNIAFVMEMFFGDSSWMNALRGETGTPVVIPYGIFLVISCTCIAFALYLAVTPLKSASIDTDSLVRPFHSQRDVHLAKVRSREDLIEKVEEIDVQGSFGTALVDLGDCYPKRSSVEYKETSESSIESSSYLQKPAADNSSHSLPAYPIVKPLAVDIFSTEITDPISSNTAIDDNAAESAEVMNPVEKLVKSELIVKSFGEADEPSAMECDKSVEIDLCSTTLHPVPQTDIKGKSPDAESSPKQPVLGRAARKQLATILEEFWGHLFDYHGKLVQEASSKKMDVLLGFGPTVVSSSAITDNQTTESLEKHLNLLPNPRDQLSPARDAPNEELPYGIPIGTSSWSPQMQLPKVPVQNSGSNLMEQSGKAYGAFSTPAYSDSQYYQPATVHGYQLASYLKGLNASRNPYYSVPLDSQRYLPVSSASNFGDPVVYAQGEGMPGALGSSGLQSETVSRVNRLLAERSYYDLFPLNGSGNYVDNSYPKKYHTSPDISAIIAATRNSMLSEGRLSGAGEIQSSLSTMVPDQTQYMDFVSKSRVSVALDGNATSQLHGNVYPLHSNPSPYVKSLWSREPFEQLYGMRRAEASKAEGLASQRSPGIPINRTTGFANNNFSYADSEAELLRLLKFCIVKLVRLEGSAWLFGQNGGCDEALIDQIAARENLFEENASDQTPDILLMQAIPNCGDDCIWRASLVISFGVWCIRRILDLSLVESRPELWGKYTYVLNRLQGILDQAFKKPRLPVKVCLCLHTMKAATTTLADSDGAPITTASMVLDMIKKVENAVSGRKGRTGTAAGDVAFPKGKENLSSVLKRYKRRLSGKAPVGQ